MKYSILFAILCLNISYGQRNKNKTSIVFKPESCLYMIKTNNSGDNFLAKANEPRVGIGVNLNVLQLQNFKLGVGYDYIVYSITDITRAGNIGSSRYNSFYGLLAYEIKISNEFHLQPYLGFGSVKLNFKSGSRRFGHQTGNDFRIGCNVDYKLDKTVSAFAGFGFVSSNYGINAAPEFVSFYDNSKMLQINIGIKLN